MQAYDTITEAINGLRARGYNLDFNLHENCLVCVTGRFNVADFEITEVHRFEGQTDPADEAVVYAIESHKGDKGILVTGYGISTEGMDAEIINKLSLHH
jgi:hypothetical protein